MADYIPINDAELAPESPLTTSLAFRWKNNLLAMFEGATGAPRLQTGAITNLAVTTGKIADGAVTQGKHANASVGLNQLIDNSVQQSKMAPLAIGRVQLRTNTVSTAGTLGAGESVTITLTQHAFFPSIRVTEGLASAAVLGPGSGPTNPDVPNFAITNTSASAIGIGAAWRYIDS